MNPDLEPTNLKLHRETGDARWLDRDFAKRNAGSFMAAKARKVKAEKRRSQLTIEQSADKSLVYLRSVFCSAKKNAAKKGLTFSITDDDLVRLYLKAGGKCMVTGIAFNLDRYGSARAPFSPSIDRIDSSRGYEPDNVRLTCQIANLAMNVWGPIVLMEFVSKAKLA